MNSDRRLIEDLIPVQVIGDLSAREKQASPAGHISSLHQWWARRPLAAARAAVYSTLVRAEEIGDGGSATYFAELCRWDVAEGTVSDARQRLLEASDNSPPCVLDLFAGGGAIPFEAARLGCQPVAVELNPVAHIIQRCLLEYPQRFGNSLADDVRTSGRRWIEKAHGRVGHLYPPVPQQEWGGQLPLEAGDVAADMPGLRPVAYLWTRTVRCPNPVLPAHTVPLVRQTWLANRKGRVVALRPSVDREKLTVEWEVVEAPSPSALGFDPAGFSKRGQSTCLVCQASLDNDYIKSEGLQGQMGRAALAAVVPRSTGRGRDYLAAGDYPELDDQASLAVLADLDVQPPDEPICTYMDAGFRVAPYGLTRFRDLFTPRQLATLCALSQGVRETFDELKDDGMEEERAAAVCSHLALVVDRAADFGSTLCRWVPEKTVTTFARQALPMVWDFSEVNPFGGASGDLSRLVDRACAVIEEAARLPRPTRCYRTSATDVPLEDSSVDAVVTDPPYYDNISYADLSDFFYVWLQRSVGFLYPEHLVGDLTPKKREITSFAERHGGTREEGRTFYEEEMAAAFREAYRVLKPSAPLVCVYAHKTTLGWAALVEALRRARFSVTEAWPLDTEMRDRSRGQNSAALASSIFIVARRRDADGVGDFSQIVSEVSQVVDERLARLTEAGVSGSDLVIATIGAGLRPFTRYASVEFSNGESVPADRFLEEVQARVLDAILTRVYGLTEGVGTIDDATRYYVVARYSFGYGEIDFDEANNLARTAGVELDELAAESPPLVSIRRGRVKLLDFQERGEDSSLGLVPAAKGVPRVIDILHALLWRSSHDPRSLRRYFDETRPDPEKLRFVAQALQGRGLSRGEEKPMEARSCERLLGAWRTLVEENLLTSA